MQETVLQFGGGVFLRGFADLILAQSNRDGVVAPGRAVEVSRLEDVDPCDARGDAFEVAICGGDERGSREQIERVDSISRVLRADREWPEVCAFARRPELRWIILDAGDAGRLLAGCQTTRPADGRAPRGLAAMLLEVLLARYEGGCCRHVTVVPCGSAERNGEKMRDAIATLARRWKVAPTVRAWLRDGVRWVNNLADRVVESVELDNPGRRPRPPRIRTESYAFWAMETVGNEPFWDHPSVVLTEDLGPFRLRKARIMDAALAALAAYAPRFGVKTVDECIGHPEIGPWLDEMLFEEIVPVLADQVPNALLYASVTLDRCANRFITRPLAGLARGREAEARVCLAATLDEYRARFGRSAPRISEALGDRSVGKGLGREVGLVDAARAGARGW